MVFIQLIVVLIFILIGARIGGMSIAYAGATGVIVLGFLGANVNPAKGIPWDVLGVIMAVISCVAALEAAGGLELLVMHSERLLRKHPDRITFYAPLVTFFMTVFCGTGHVAFATLPVIAEVAKEQKVRPSRPLTIAAVASQIGICASPISAATIAMVSILAPDGITYPVIVGITVVVCLIGVLGGAVVASRTGVDLEKDPIYQERKAQGLVTLRGKGKYEIVPRAGTSLIIFASAIVLVMVYAAAITKVSNPPLPRAAAIMAVMMAAGLVIVLCCHVKVDKIATQATFRSGMNAALCVLGVAWLGNTFVESNIATIKAAGSGVIQAHPWLLAVVLFFGSALLYSQAATAITFMPVAAALGLPGSVLLASYAACSGLFFLPTYPTTVAAVGMDDTGTTRLGRFVVDHPFQIPGIATIAIAVVVAYGVTALLL